MIRKLVELQKRTLTLIQHSSVRLAELNNILTIIHVYFEYARKGEKHKFDMPSITRQIEKRIRKLERFPRFAGNSEKYKMPPP